MDKPQVTTLENGLTVITQKTDTLQPFVQVTVGVGSRHETPETAGIFHNLEHIVAGATEELGNKELAQKIKSMRATSNANTSFEKTNYYWRGGHEYLSEGMQMIADGIQNPFMDDKNVDKERGAIIAEIQMRLSNPDVVSYFDFLDTAYEGGNLGRDICGSAENIARFSPQNLQDAMDQYYSSDNMTLIVAGNVDHDEICKMAASQFDTLPRQHASHNYDAVPQTYRGGYRVKEKADKENLEFNLGFEIPDMTTRDRTLAGILGSIIGGGFDSRLMEELRTKRGLVYGASASPQFFSDMGLFAVDAEISDGNTKEAIHAICEELVNAIDTITEEELEGVRNAAVGQLERMESTEQKAQRTVSQFRELGEISTPEESIARMNTITAQELRDFARKVFSSVPTVHAVGKGVDQVPSYEEITGLLGNKRKLDAAGHALETAPSANRDVAEAKVAGKPKPQERRVA